MVLFGETGTDKIECLNGVIMNIAVGLDVEKCT